MTPKTTLEAVAAGGWFWYRGKVTASRGHIYNYTEEVIFIPYPEHQTNRVCIPFYGDWLNPEDFAGEWYGPITPPWKENR